MKIRILMQIALGGIAAIVLWGGCDPNPVAARDEFRLNLPRVGTKLLCGDTLSVSWSPAVDSALLHYKDVTGGLDGLDTAWKPLPPVWRASCSASVVLPMEITDSLLLSVTNGQNGRRAERCFRLNHFVLTTYPQPGCTLSVGDTVAIAWRASQAIDRSILFLAQEGGRTFGYITADAAIFSPQTSHQWIIGSGDGEDLSYPAGDCSVFITDYDLFEWTDKMPGSFTIVTPDHS